MKIVPSISWEILVAGVCAVTLIKDVHAQGIRVLALDTVTISDPVNSLSRPGGLFRITGKMAAKMPLALSEPDFLKAIQFLPGVQGGDDGSSSIHVRGGSPDQTLILIDGVPVYNISHLFGFFSVLNPDVIATADLYKSELPARYGGRLSSVLDITMREGNKSKMEGGVHISPISTKLRLEGPLKKDTSSYIISFRRSWIDLISSLAQRISGNSVNSHLGFSDFTFKVNHRFNRREQIFVNSYWGKDSFGTRSRFAGFDSRQSTSWGNLTGVVRYHRIFGNRLLSRNTLSYTQYKSQLKSSSDVDGSKASSQIKSVIKDLSLKTDWSYDMAQGQKVEWGAGISRHLFRPDLQRREGNVYAVDLVVEEPATTVMDYQLYGQMERKFGNLDIRMGFHYFSEFRIKEGRSFQVVFHAASGNFITLPTAHYSAQPGIISSVLPDSRASDRFIRLFDELEYLHYRNNFQMRSNHHLDVSYRVSKKKKNGFRTWTFSVYNVYNRKNPYFLFLENEQLKQFSLLPVLPSVSYEYLF